MPKIGPAFSDFVSGEKIQRRRSSTGSSGKEFLLIFPIFALFLIVSIVVLRLFYLQILRGNYYKTLAEQNRTRTKIIAAPRGVILDKKGRALVRNYPSFKLVVEGEAKKLQSTSLASVKIISKDDALERIAKNENVILDTQREYVYKDNFAHVLGYTGQISEEEAHQKNYSSYDISDFIGKMGLERQYERVLHGENGRELYEVDAAGKQIRFLGRMEPTPGESLKTTLDLDLQRWTVEALKGASKAAVIISDPRNGSILTLVSKPTFDPNLFTHGATYKGEGQYQTLTSLLTDLDNQPFLNRVISGLYPPGSTYKLVTAIAALESEGITRNTEIVDTGILKVGAFSFGNWYFLQYGKTDGVVDVVKAIKRSNDIFFYKAAEAAGIKNIFNMSKIFGIGDLYGIDIPGETTGTVPNPEWKEKNIGEQWYLGDTYNLGIGQGFLLTTPLEVNMWTSVFANGGTLFQPHIVDGESKILRQDFVKRENIELVREGMKQSCETGGVAFPFFDFKVKNPKLKIDGHDYIEQIASGGARFVRIKVGCKTGTAETGGEHTKPHAWITVFAPFYKPEVVVTVLSENSGEGSSIAGPIARDILRKYFENKK